MSRERIKTFILSILVIMSLLLTQKIWFHSPFQSTASDSVNINDAVNLEEMRNDITSPIRVLLGFGGGRNLNSYYSVLALNDLTDAWRLSKAVLESFFNGDPEVTPINIETYYESIGSRFIELEFGDSISTVLVSSVFNSMDSKIVRNIREIKKIMIPANNTGIIYIKGKDSNYFHVKLDNYSNDILVSYINEYDKKDFVKYFDLLSYVDNFTVMPINLSIPLPQIYVESEIDIDNETQLNNKSKIFFKNIDFIKTIKETTGSVVYLYGYGEKSLRINNRGRLEYREEFDPVSNTNVKKALETALLYMELQGDMSDNLYLREIRDIEYKQRKGLLFGFGYHLEGYPVHTNTSGMNHAIEIEVVGNRIRGYRTFIRRKMNIPAITKLEPIISPHKIIDNNLELIVQNYIEAEGNPQSIESIKTEVIKSISEVQLVYFDSINEAKQQLLEPSWRIRVKNHVYYFDIYKGRLLDSSLLN